MPSFMLLIRDGDFYSFSRDEQQKIVKEFSAWARSLNEAGCLKDADPLGNTGRVVRKNDGQITDGPYAETKEGIGGYFLIEAESIEAATEIARGCPGLHYGDAVEVRPIIDHLS